MTPKLVATKSMTAVEKVNGCMALLIDLCMRQTNADTFHLKSWGVRYQGKLLGDYQLTIQRLPQEGKKNAKK